MCTYCWPDLRRTSASSAVGKIAVVISNTSTPVLPPPASGNR